VLGGMYHRGVAPVQVDNVAAVAWFSRAAEAGFSAAMINLGLMYENGSGVGRDFTRAGSFYQQGAGKGNPAGFYHLGRLLESGRGVRPNFVQAYVCYVQGASFSEEAAKARDSLKAKLSKEQIADVEKALKDLAK
ncbi:MAG: tetratricopeptide repeat protein, partial [Verrucomicrobiales bacterium]